MAPRPGGVVQIFSAEGMQELHASTCAHCSRITTFPHRKKMQEHVDVCRSCFRLICLECADKPCRPWIKEVERQEARARMLRDMGIV